MLFKSLVINVGEVDIIKFHAAQLFQLLFDTAAHFQGQPQDLLELVLAVFPVRVEDFDQAVNHPAHGNGIALVQVAAKPEVPVQRIPVLFLTQFAQEFRQIVRDEAIVVGKVFRPELGDLPPGDITVHAVQECRIRTHLRREGIKQAAGLQQDIHALVDVADEYHRGAGGLFFLATGKRTGGHVVLHDLDAVFILEVNARHLIEGHAVPQTHKADGLPAHVVEQVGHCSLAARDQDAVGRDFLVQVTLTSTPGTKLTKVEVVLYQRDHTRQQEPLLTLSQGIRLHADGTQQDVHPFFLGERFPALLQLIDVHVGHLDRRQLPDLYRIAVLLVLLDELVIQLHDAPNTTAEQPVELLRVLVGNGHGLQAEIGELGLIDIALDIQAYRDFVNDGIASTGTKDRENFLRFIRTHKVICQNTFNIFNASFDDFFIVRAAILSQKELKDIDGNVGPFLDFLCKVFPDNLSVETLTELIFYYFSLSLFNNFSFVHICTYIYRVYLTNFSKSNNFLACIAIPRLLGIMDFATGILAVGTLTIFSSPVIEC